MGPNPIENTQLLTVKQLAASLNISTHWIYKRTAQGSPQPLPYIAVGRGKRFDLSAVRNHLEVRESLPTGVMLPGTDGIARVNGKAFRRMTRRRFQTGSVRLRKDRQQPWWEGFYRADIITEAGTITRKRKSVMLGLQSDLPNKSSALRKLSEILSEINSTNYRPKSEITFRSFVSKYRELKLEMKKETTKHGYETVIRKHLLPFFGDTKLAEIDTELVQVFINKKKAEKKKYNTLHNVKFVLSSIFTAALKWEYLKENPVRNAELGPEEVREPETLPTAQHLDTLIAGLDDPYSTMVWFHAIATTRSNEGFAFKFTDLDIESCRLTLSRAVNRGEFHTPKYHRSNRPIQLTRADVDRLLEYKKRMNLADDDWFFPSKKRENPLRHEDVLSRKIQPRAKELGLPHVTWRILRKWGSTQMIADRIPVKAAQDRLGHSRPDIILRHYAQLTDESSRQAAELLSGKLSGKLAAMKPVGRVQ